MDTTQAFVLGLAVGVIGLIIIMWIAIKYDERKEEKENKKKLENQKVVEWHKKYRDYQTSVNFEIENLRDRVSKLENSGRKK